MLPTTSKVAMLHEIRPPEARPFSIEEIDIPPLTDGAILGRMRLAGICGTDVHILHGKVTINPHAQTADRSARHAPLCARRGQRRADRDGATGSAQAGDRPIMVTIRGYLHRYSYVA
jgi:NADPH:quinone reductase-like Zn-dependent oxidoreductase